MFIVDFQLVVKENGKVKAITYLELAILITIESMLTPSWLKPLFNQLSMMNEYQKTILFFLNNVQLIMLWPFSKHHKQKNIKQPNI